MLTFLTHAHTQAKKKKRQALFKLIAVYILGKGGVSQKDKNWINFPTEASTMMRNPEQGKLL